ncbi:hypothetical protein FQN49_000306 [Arthroderma sp. PD_2]|nr:hypothetical protein FQN49_000306 [Arthroderma sp. PD_2]
MAQNYGLGNFTKLPYELREQIWLEFFPVEQDNEAASERTSIQTSAKTDLRILRASKCLYHEISPVIYSKTCLYFDLSPLPSESFPFWSALRLRRRINKDTVYDGGAVWRLESSYDERSTHFDNFPFDKVTAIELSLTAPEDPPQFFWLWRNVIRTIELLKKAPSLPHLTIQLRKGKDLNVDEVFGEFPTEEPGYSYYSQCLREFLPKRKFLSWVDTCVGNHSKYIYNSHGQYIYDILVIPFYSLLRNTTSVHVEAHSKEIKDKMDWTKIHNADGVLSRRVKGCKSFEFHIAERELWHNNFCGWDYMHDWLFWDHMFVGGIVSFLQAEWDNQTFKSSIDRPAEVWSPVTKSVYLLIVKETKIRSFANPYD